MTPAPAELTITPGYFSNREALATHKFNQKRIMGMAARRELMVQYYHRVWTFIEPDGLKAYAENLSDEDAIKWLSSVSYPREEVY